MSIKIRYKIILLKMASEREEAINLTDVTDSSSPPSNDDAAVDVKSEKEESKEVLDLVDGDSRKSSSGGDGGLKVLFLSSDTVSYTHLTLPTNLRV